MARSSRAKKAGRAKRTAFFTLLFTALLAPAILLVLDKALPEGLFGGGTASPKNIRLSLRQVSRGVLEGIGASEKGRPVPKSPKADKSHISEHDFHFSNKGNDNEIDNTQETGSGSSAAFSNEGDGNRIKNVQRTK